MSLSLRLFFAIAIGVLVALGGALVTSSLVNVQPDSAVTYSYGGS
jgi:hypothetical protein